MRTDQDDDHSKGNENVIQPTGACLVSGESDTKKQNIDAITAYVARCYPFEALHGMLTAVHPGVLREIATISARKGDGEPIVRRHMTCASAAEVRELVTSVGAFRIEAGAVWSREPVKSASGEVIAREFSIDIDADAYDGGGSDVSRPRSRDCCTGSQVCDKCWGIVALGASTIDSILEDHGVVGVGWFFSGRRGMHCWVADQVYSTPVEAVREMMLSLFVPTVTTVMSGAADGNPTMLRIVEKLVSNTTNSQQTTDEHQNETAKTKYRGAFFEWYAVLHPVSALTALNATLVKNKRGSAALVESVTAALTELTNNEHPREQRRTHLVSNALTRARASVYVCHDPWRNGGATEAAAIIEAALMCLLPRVDSAVSIQKNHLLRCPLGVHSDTMKLGVMVGRGDDIERFCPFAVPVLQHCSGAIASGRGQQAPVFDREEVAKAEIKKFSDWVAKLRDELS